MTSLETGNGFRCFMPFNYGATSNYMYSGWAAEPEQVPGLSGCSLYGGPPSTLPPPDAPPSPPHSGPDDGEEDMAEVSEEMDAAAPPLLPEAAPSMSFTYAAFLASN